MPREERSKTNRLVIYMIKPEYQRPDDMLEEAADPVAIDGVGSFYFEESHPHRPHWATDFFGGALASELRILSASAKGLLLVPVNTADGVVHFAIAFGTGRYLLKDGIVEERFGLRVVLNSIDQQHNHLRSIDKTTLGSVPKHSREQMSRDVQATEFGIDVEQDLIAAVTAKSNDMRLGGTISGKDALSVSVKVDVRGIRDFLAHCYSRYRSEDYKGAFDWIDQISEVRDKKIEAVLNADLVKKLASRDLARIWMAVPEVIEWADGKGFRYRQPKRGALHDDLDASVFLAEAMTEGVDLERLKQCSVYQISAKDDQEVHKWSAFRCFYAEAQLNEKLYVLNNGKWYGIADGFTDQVQKDYASILESSRQSALALPDCETNDEKTYNEHVARDRTEFACLDRQMIPHGGGRSTIEFCDLYSNDRKLIHVKRYGGSSVLSHLFNQGVVSSELFVGDAEFRREVNAILPPQARLSDTDVRPDASEYEVVYAVISNVPAELDLPFFSKVSLRNARRRLTSYGYRVTMKKILKIEPSEQPEPTEVKVPTEANAARAN